MKIENKFIKQIETLRVETNLNICPKARAAFAQYMSPESVAVFMSSFYKFKDDQHIKLLDPGAGIGSLTAAFVHSAMLSRKHSLKIESTCYEIDPFLLKQLDVTLKKCKEICDVQNIDFTYTIKNEDFIESYTKQIFLSQSLFEQEMTTFTHCIMNPPYKKINSNSNHRKYLREIGIETTNLYTGFLSVAIHTLEENGELVAIVPRSFCNGSYFKPFREFLFQMMNIKNIHVFDSRNKAFKDDDVLQENIIFYAVKDKQNGNIGLSSSEDLNLKYMKQRTIKFSSLVKKDDPDKFIHIAVNDSDQHVVNKLSVFKNSLGSVGLDVSTGPVVDFRLKEYLRFDPEENTCPLIYPAHFIDSFVTWPIKNLKKPNAFVVSDDNRKWLMPKGWYVLTRRFSSKEEKKRIVIALFKPDDDIENKLIGFENHINVFHSNKEGLEPLVAKGLAVYLSSSLVDTYYRQFSGHTQVNAGDLRNIHYPNLEGLKKLGSYVDKVFPEQNVIDDLLEEEINFLNKNGQK